MSYISNTSKFINATFNLLSLLLQKEMASGLDGYASNH